MIHVRIHIVCTYKLSSPPSTKLVIRTGQISDTPSGIDIPIYRIRISYIKPKSQMPFFALEGPPPSKLSMWVLGRAINILGTHYLCTLFCSRRHFQAHGSTVN